MSKTKTKTKTVHELKMEISSGKYLHRNKAFASIDLPKSFHHLTAVRTIRLCLCELQKFFPTAFTSEGSYTLWVGSAEFDKATLLHVREPDSGCTPEEYVYVSLLEITDENLNPENPTLASFDGPEHEALFDLLGISEGDLSTGTTSVVWARLERTNV